MKKKNLAQLKVFFSFINSIKEISGWLPIINRKHNEKIDGPYPH